jgi:tetratricopeptide (TPR) repeat protein
MTANHILIIVIGFFLITTGALYLINLKGKKEASRREKVVSIVLMVVGALVVIYPIILGISFNNASKAKDKPSQLLGADYYQKPIQQDASGYEEASFLYQKAAAMWNVQKTGFDSSEIVMEILNRSIAIYETAEAYTARGQVKAQLSKFQDALKDYDRAVELKPDFGNAYFNRATVHYIMGDNNAACADWKIANDLGVPNTEETLKMLCN